MLYRRQFIRGGSAVALAAGWGCSRSPGGERAVLFSSVDEYYALQVASRFEEKSRHGVDLVSDTEAAKSTGLFNRIVAERERPSADVFWSGDLMRAIRLRDLGLTSDFPESGEPGSAFSLPLSVAGLGLGSARIRMILVHEGASDRPESVAELAETPFAARTCLANPLFGTTSMHLAALLETWGAGKLESFLERFVENGGRLVASNGEVKRRVGNGEFDFGLTDSDDVAVALADGMPVDFLVPDQGEDDEGAVLIPSAVALIKNGPHPISGEKLARYLASEDLERFMAESAAAHFPLRDSVPPPSIFGFPLQERKILSLDYESMARQFPEWRDGFLKPWTSRTLASGSA